MGVFKLGNSSEWNQVERVILERRSIRYFKEEQVPEELVKRVLEAGRFAPSHGNCQPWKFVVIRDRKMLDEMTASVAEIWLKSSHRSRSTQFHTGQSSGCQ
ncbi:MAG: hypothetical protein AVO34_14200 [Firmicutes bacterium ML8_F2]|nr:MAG: hypothetical protein AVO34_14200 [Firmicutes bacterium ML8_F2]